MKVDRTLGPDACHPWTAFRDAKNFGRVANGRGGSAQAHRAGWEFLHGPITPGAVIDHTCHNTDPNCPGGDTCEHRACQNPKHWEEVTERENVARGKSFSAVNARKTHCPRGHALTPDNCYTSTGGRTCVTCAKARAREYAQRVGNARRRARRAHS